MKGDTMTGRGDRDEDGDRTAADGAASSGGELEKQEAMDLARRIQGCAARIAEQTCEFLLLIAAFDGGDGLRWYQGLKSLAHWVAWSCSMSTGTAREHVRVARALPGMPLTVAAFREGRLSYSKVREMTRVAGMVEEAELLELARDMTASQLARTVRGFRSAVGTRAAQEDLRETSWRVREDGMLELHAVLPAEIGAELVTAIELAVDRQERDERDRDLRERDARGASPRRAHRIDAEGEMGVEPGRDVAREIDVPGLLEPRVDEEPLRTIGARRADALSHLARAYLDAEDADRTGADHHLVVVQVDASALAASRIELAAAAQAEDVPAGTPPVHDRQGPTGPQRAGVSGLGPIEAATAERLACDNPVALVITDDAGEVLHLGRRRRLASPAQRRALHLRDATCQFPGCGQTRHLDAHHLVPWSRGGRTDLEDLVLLCRRHHVHCHEKGLRLVRRQAFVPRTVEAADAPGTATRTSRIGRDRFAVVDAAGRPVQSGWPPALELVTAPSTSHASVTEPGVDPGAEPSVDPERIFPLTGGYGFDLGSCVAALIGARTVEVAA